MEQISGFHHVTLPARDVELSGDWYGRVFGFECVLMEEDADRVTAVLLQHPVGMVLALHMSDDLIPQWQGRGVGTTVLSFRVPSHNELVRWDERLTDLGIEHSGPHPAHLGWALDVTDPSGLRIQLHTHEVISVDDEQG